MRRTALGPSLAVFLAVFPVATAQPAAAAGDAAEVTERLRAEFGLTDAEVGEVAPQVRVHVRAGGGVGVLRAMLRSALADGCRAGCLGEVLHAVNRAVALGYDADEAERMVAEELHRAAADGGAAGLGDRLRARMERRHRRIPPPAMRIE
jgi:hypothetical protein